MEIAKTWTLSVGIRVKMVIDVHPLIKVPLKNHKKTITELEEIIKSKIQN